MKLKIKIAFNDKYNKNHYNVNDIVEFDDKRANELLCDKRNLVEAIVEEVVEEKKEEKKKRK